MGVVSVGDYEAGYKENLQANVIRLRDTANDWKLLVKTNDSDMGIIGSYIKPISDFSWRAEGDYATQTIYREITNYDIEVARGPRGSFKWIVMDYRVQLLWDRDVPGDYNINILYTLTTQ